MANGRPGRKPVYGTTGGGTKQSVYLGKDNQAFLRGYAAQHRTTPSRLVNALITNFRKQIQPD